MQDAWPGWIRKDINRMVSVDVETAGPNPADYALLSIGACTLGSPRKEFYVELQPTTMKADEQASEIHQLDLDQLSKTGQAPNRAMQLMANWLTEEIPSESPPLFLGFNAPFDWMFICDYFQRFLGHNPFGHSAIDIRSFYMGLSQVEWENTRMAQISTKALKHNALEDACDQAELFKRMILGTK
jgi:DNA polymerase III epsilon subunit-like protein